MIIDYICLQGKSVSICDNFRIRTSNNDLKHRLLIHSPKYPNEYENSLNCSCEIGTKKSRIEFLDFYLEERDEMNLCTQDYLSVGNGTYCDSTIDRMINLNSSIYLTFRTNDIIKRRGFWLMVNSDQSLQVSCKNLSKSVSLITPILQNTVRSISLTTIKNTFHFHLMRRYTLSFILILNIISVVALLFLNLVLIVLCWRQRHSNKSVNPNARKFHPSSLCSKHFSTSSSSSITYDETPVITPLDAQRQQTALIAIPTSSIYKDQIELLTLQHKQRYDRNHSFYLEPQHEQKAFCSNVLLSTLTNTDCNDRSHFYISNRAYNSLDSQHIYERTLNET